MVGYYQLRVSQRLGVSQTAVEIINGRWTMDVFGLREDSAARTLAGVIPNNSVAGLWLTLFPLWAVQKLLGVSFLYPTLPAPERAAIANMVPSRTVEFDTLLNDLAPKADQLVILGAGLDTRAYGAFKRHGWTIYEVDEAKNQTHKRAALVSAGIASDHVRFVTADFSQPDWIETLLASDYREDARTVFLWEGVTLYLPPSAIARTLATLRAHSAPSSVVLADLYGERILKYAKSKAISWTLEMTDEAMNFGLDFSSDAQATLAGFAQSNLMGLGRHQFLGSANKNGPFMVICELQLGRGPRNAEKAP